MALIITHTERFSSHTEKCLNKLSNNRLTREISTAPSPSLSSLHDTKSTRFTQSIVGIQNLHNQSHDLSHAHTHTAAPVTVLVYLNQARPRPLPMGSAPALLPWAQPINSTFLFWRRVIMRWREWVTSHLSRITLLILR